MSDLPNRKRLRLAGYDYSQAGAYFVTICAKDRHNLFGRIDVGANCVRPKLSNAGIVSDNELQRLSGIYESVRIDKYVIMPNHIHMMIMIEAEDGGRTQFAPTVSGIMKQFKGSITKQLGISPWQKSFHDHIIRDEDEYLKIWQYIDENPAKWAEDCYYMA